MTIRTETQPAATGDTTAAESRGVVTGPGTIQFERVLPGPVERVWSYLVDSDKRGQWLASGPLEQRVGGRVELTFRNSELTPHDEPVPEDCRKYEGKTSVGRVTRWEPQRVLAYSWGGEPGSASEVTFELSPRDDGQVLLVLTHRRLDGRKAMLGVSGGWDTHLGVLADRLADRTPRPFWSTHARLKAEYERMLPADAGK
jgi:uncharacterized protein YndB with AHSA1/START domain